MNRRRQIPVILFLFASVMFPTAALAQGLTIKVIDENNKGVYSRVYYEDGTKPPSFSNTDQSGDVPQPPPECGKMRTLYAHPFDSGSYFDSPAEPCATKVVLRVVSRQTPKGMAINYQFLPFTLPDGSPGIITLKGALESNASNTSPGGMSGTKCQVTLNAIADQNAFKVQGDRWVPLKQTTTAFSNVFAKAAQPDLQTVTLPSSCEKMRDRVQTLQASAVNSLDRSVNKDSIMVEQTLRSLGYR